MSYVCPKCSYKIIQPQKKVYPELNRTIMTPETIAWDDYTLTNCSESSGVISLDTNETSGTVVSPQLANLTRNDTTDMQHDITRVLFRTLVASNNGGRIKLHASNDAGTTWKRIKDNNQEWRLNHGHEGDFGGTYQSKYDDLRLKFTLTRSSASDTSPTVTSFVLEHNYKPDSRKTKGRQHINNILLGR